MSSPITRRNLIKSAPLAAATLATGCAATGSTTARAAQAQAANAEPKRWQGGVSPWPICLDSATIRPSPFEAKIRIAAAAGYDAIEPWEGELHEYEQQGGNLQDLGKRIRDAGMFVPSVIGLWGSLPPTREQFDASLEATRRRMRQASDLGAEFVQLVPQPARAWRDFDPKWAADRYRELLEIGINDYNIKPAVVFVEFLEGSRRMGQAAAIAIDANHPDATIIPDVYHMHIADSGFNGIKHLNGDFFAIFQFNDAPANPPKEQLKDEHRVYPGDGILPLTDILRDLKATGFSRCISLELYNPTYWEQDHLTVAQTGLEKTLNVIQAAGV
ncbi:MAG: sugar phosphate isomerase/epimerase family protein [Phycisphaerales bacterium JB063]